MIKKNLRFNKEALVAAASDLENLFLKYSKMNGDVAIAFKRCKPLIDKVTTGQITAPTSEKLDATYFSPEFDLINYKDLYEKAAELDMFLEGWGSEEEYNQFMEVLLSK